MRSGLVAAVLAAVLSWAAPARADTIKFDPDGAGAVWGAVTIDLFDPVPGNSISVGINANSVVGDTGRVLFQANLGIGSLEGVTQFSSCLGGADCFTFAAAIDVVVTAAGAVLALALDPLGTSVLNMYAATTPGDNLAGTDFTTGNLILSGTFDSFLSTFVATGGGPGTPLDNFGDNDYPNTDTVTGGGFFTGRISVNLGSLDPNYFPESFQSFVLRASSQNILPYEQVDPSACFSSDAVADCNYGGAGTANVGPVNALGPDTMLQTDANVSFEVQQVPEPAMLALLGMGLVVASTRLRQRRTGRRQQ